MGVPGAIQVTLQAPSQDAMVNSWSLPAFVVSMRSASVMMGINIDGPGGAGGDLVIIRSRIADALGIQNGDEVDFFVNEIRETWRLRVRIRDDITSDILIHDLFTLKLAKSYDSGSYGSGEEVTLKSGTVLRNPSQEMWAGMKIVEKKGSAQLYFDGASRNNPHGPCGYGFHIGTDGANKCNLIQGSGYAGMERSSNEMEYEGLIEGLIWATRLDLKRLTIVGDSELIINQLTGEYAVNNDRLRALYDTVQDLLAKASDLEVTYQHIPRGSNQIADSLANQAIAARVNVTTCNWRNINALMAVDMSRYELGSY